jgi:hypothetical protein
VDPKRLIISIFFEWQRGQDSGLSSPTRKQACVAGAAIPGPEFSLPDSLIHSLVHAGEELVLFPHFFFHV